MKKLIVIFIVTMFTITGFVSANIQNDKNLSFISDIIIIDKPIINEKEEFIYLDLLDNNNKIFNIGKPVLPKIVKTYEFPFGTKINNIDITFFDKYEMVLSKPIEPTPEIKMISTIYEDTNDINENFDYSDINMYPKNQFSFR